MKDKINVAELLKDCPKGMELYSPIFGKVYLDKIRPHLAIVVTTDKEQGDFKEEFLYDGRHGMNGECMLFPSKDKTTWEGFQRPFKDGDVVCYSDSIAIFKEWGDETLFRTHVTAYLHGDSKIDVAIPLFGKSIRREARFATEEEKQKLFQAIKANGYKWNYETKTLEKLVEPKFKVGDKAFVFGNKCTIIDAVWDEGIDDVVYTIKLDTSKYTTTKLSHQLQPYKEEIKMKSLIEILREKNIKAGDKLQSRVLGTVFFVDFVNDHPIKHSPCKLIMVRAYSHETHPTNYYFSEYGKLLLNFSGHEYSYEQDLFLPENYKEVAVNHDEDFQFKEGSIIHDKVYGSTYIFKKYDKSTNTLYYYARCLMNGDLCYNGKSLFEGSIRRTHEGFISSDNFRLATEHEKSRVHNSLYQAGYQWNSDNLKLVSITKPDISSRFTTFDHVLVRDLDSDTWRADFYYSYDDTPINDCNEGILHTPFKTILSSKNWAQCIPFNLETKHLIDTNLACPEKFVIW